MKRMLCFSMALALAAAGFGEPAPIRIGIIGLDTSHAVKFTKIFNTNAPLPGLEGARVTVAYPQGSKDIFSSTNRLPGYTKQMQELGVQIVPTLTGMLAQCDAVLLESNDGRVHLEQATEVFKAGKPCFIDKPLAANLKGALQIYAVAAKYHAAFFSCSSLRYGDSTLAVRAGKHGRIQNVTTWSPCFLEPTHDDFTWYGIHGVETLYTALGTGCQTVSRVSTSNTDVTVGTWLDGRVGTFIGNRNAPYRIGFGAFTDQEALYEESVYKKGSAPQTAKTGLSGEAKMLADVLNFFRTRVAPINPKETLEMFVFMEAADISKRQGGAPVSLAKTLADAQAELEPWLLANRQEPVGKNSDSTLRVGIGRACVTPDFSPVWLAGYAARNNPAEGKYTDLFVKALAFECGGKRAVLVTFDTLNVPHNLIAELADFAARQFGLKREELFLNASHTHSAPEITSLEWASIAGPERRRAAARCYRLLRSGAEKAITEAMHSLAPAVLRAGQTELFFGKNRRGRALAPSDPSTPVLTVSTPEGKLRAVIYSYACHGTTLTAENLRLNGDHAGFAMLQLETEFPGVTAFYLQGCGGDQNPDPRHTLELAKQYGTAAATAVKALITSHSLKTVEPEIQTSLEIAQLPFAPYSIESFHDEAEQTEDPFLQWRGVLMLDILEATEGYPPAIPCRIQALRLGKNLVFLGISGEVVIDYALRSQKEFGAAAGQLIVTGYTGEGENYLPTLRVLQEGGYESGGAMVYSGRPGRLDESVERRVFESIGHVLRQVGVTPATDSSAK